MNDREIIKELLSGSKLLVDNYRIYYLNDSGLRYKYKDSDDDVDWPASELGIISGVRTRSFIIHRKGIKEEVLEYNTGDISTTEAYKNLSKLLGGEALKFEDSPRHSIRLMPEGNVLLAPSPGQLLYNVINKPSQIIKRRK